MQTVQTKKKRSVAHGGKPNGESTLRYLVEGTRTTHVMVPIDEYERLMLAEMAADAERISSDPATKWTNVDDFFADVAAKRLVTARKAKGITQQELANRLGIAQTQISRIEKNPDRTTLRTLKRIAKALRVDVRDLID